MKRFSWKRHGVALALGLACAGASAPAQTASNADRLSLPPLAEGPPTPGHRVLVTPPEYTHTDVYHVLYLPPDWTPAARDAGQRWPVIVEYTGNYAPTLGSTGEAKDAALGFGISGGRFIWVVLPYIREDHQGNALTWWGDIDATVDYAKRNVPRICAEYGGQTDAVFICGFSRGAIGVNFLGLHDDEIARLWRGFITHDHYDGLKEWKNTAWGSPWERYRAEARQRLQRLQGRPVLICQHDSARATEKALSDDLSLGAFTFLDVPMRELFSTIPNELFTHPHTDRWLLEDSPTRRTVWAWIDTVLRTPGPAPQPVSRRPAPSGDGASM